MVLRAGALRHRIKIEVLTPTQDGTGEEIGSWDEFAIRWASVEPFTGREIFSSQQVHADITHRIRLRYLPGVVPKMRVVFKGRIFDIKYIISFQERDRELELLSTEDV